jgi:hypothetical protein
MACREMAPEGEGLSEAEYVFGWCCSMGLLICSFS